MKTMVTYMSQSGNTKKVAEAIYGAIEGEKNIRPLDEVEDLEGYDLTYIGFPVHQFGAPAPAKAFLEQKAQGKRVALFVTHAMPQDMEMLGGIMDKCRAAAAGAEVIGVFDCQGELAEPVAQFLINSPNPNLQRFGQMRPVTIGHPNAQELEEACSFACQVQRG